MVNITVNNTVNIFQSLYLYIPYPAKVENMAST